MRWLLVALLLASCVAVQKPVQTPTPDVDPEPPVWVSQFAKAFCQMDRTTMDKHLSADLQELRTPEDWPCRTVARYLGYGNFTDGSVTYYFRFDFGDHTPTYGFIVGPNTEIVETID